MDPVILFHHYLTAQKTPVSENTLRNYLSDLKKFISWYELTINKKFDPSSITSSDIEKYEQSIVSQTKGSSSLERSRASLRKFFTLATIHGQISNSPFTTARPPSQTNPFHINEFKYALLSQKKGESTIRNYLIDIEHFLNWIKTTKAHDYDVSEKNYWNAINPVSINEYRSRLSTVLRLSTATIERKLSAIKSFCQWASDSRYLSKNPFSYVPLLPTNESEMALSEHDAHDLIPSAYSSFAPIRLLQKIGTAIDLVIFYLFLLPLSKLAKKQSSVYVKDNKLASFYQSSTSSAHSGLTTKLLSLPAWSIVVIILVVLSGSLSTGVLGAFVYSKYLQKAQPQKQNELASISQPQAPPGLVYKGTLTAKDGTPITSPTLVIFSFYSDPENFTSLLYQQAQDITPDQNGQFSITFKDLPEKITGSTSSLYLGIAVSGDAEMRPRQVLAPLGNGNFAFLPNAQLALGQNGQLVFSNPGDASESASSTYTIQGEQVAIKTAIGSSGSIALSPDGDGKIDLQAPITNSVTGVVKVNDALSLTSYGDDAGLTIDYSGTGDAFAVYNGTTPLSWIDNQGNFSTNGSLNVTGSTKLNDSLSVLGNTYLLGGLQNLSTGGLYAIWYDDTNTPGNFSGRPIKQEVLPQLLLNDYSPNQTTTQYSAKIVGYIKPDYSQNYTFYVTSKDGVRLYINHKNIIDSWGQNSSSQERSGTVSLSANQWYPIVLEYFRSGGSGSLSLEWKSNSQAREVVGNASLAYSLSEVPQTLFTSVQIDKDLTVLGNTNVSGSILPVNNNASDLGSSSNYFRTIYVNNIIGATSGIQGYFQRNDGALSPTNTSDDLLIGATATASAVFRISGTTGDASMSGTLTFSGTTPSIQTVANSTLTFGGNTTGNIILAPLNGQTGSSVAPNVTNAVDLGTSSLSFKKGYFQSLTASGNVGIGTNTPSNTLQVIGSVCIKASSINCTGQTNGHIYANSFDAEAGDVAENYLSSTPLEPGEIVVTDTSSKDSLAVSRSTKAYDTGVLGIVSSNPGVTINDQAQPTAQLPYKYPIALTGRVPLKVTTMNGVIKKGDALTASAIAGVAMKATQKGMIVARALEDYSDSSIGHITVYVANGYFDPQAVLTADGSLSTNGNLLTVQSPPSLNLPTKEDTQLTDAANNLIDKTLSYSKGLFTSLEANIITTQNLTIKQKIVSPIADIDIIHTNVISPLADSSSVTIALQKEKNQTFTISNEETPVASIDAYGNASFTGNIAASNATIDGIIRAKKIIADEVETLHTSSSSAFIQDATQSANLVIAALSSNSLSLPSLSADQITARNGFLSLGPTGLADVSISGIAQFGTSLFIKDNSIDNLDGDLKLQGLRQGGVSIADGKVVIDKNGNMAVSGNLAIAGVLSSKVISPIPDNDLAVTLPNATLANKPASNFVVKDASGSSVLVISNKGDIAASGSATVKDLIAQKLHIPSSIPQVSAQGASEKVNGSIGKGTIFAGTYEVTIESSLVTANSLIYITPTSDTNGAIPYIARQEEGTSFTVAIPRTESTDISFNWWIVN